MRRVAVVSLWSSRIVTVPRGCSSGYDQGRCFFLVAPRFGLWLAAGVL